MLTYPVTQIPGNIEQDVGGNICKEFIARNLHETRSILFPDHKKGVRVRGSAVLTQS